MTQLHALSRLAPAPAISDNARRIMERRYLLKTHDGELLETPPQMWRRVARAIASVDDRVYRLPAARVQEFEDALHGEMAAHRFIPAGRTLANAGGPTPVVQNCVVLGIDDSLDSIFSTLHDAVLLQQSGSGLGFALDTMRPAGACARTTYGSSSGPVSFLGVYSASFSIVKQQNRSGANMAVCSIEHPDVLEFIHCKEREGAHACFNISVGITDEFMRQVREDVKTPWMCHFGGVQMLPRRIERKANGAFAAATPVEMTAREILREIATAAHRNGEPGVLFLDAANRANPLPGLGPLRATNPCGARTIAPPSRLAAHNLAGEQFLHAGDVCNLGAVNLGLFVTPERELDDEALRKTTRIAIRALDNIVDLAEVRVESVHKTARDNRRLGLGIMGLADMLARMRLGYGTARGRIEAAHAMRVINEEADAESRRLCAEKGPFPNIELSIFAAPAKRRRNAATTTVAPTGTSANIVDASGGCEPHFALAYERTSFGDTLLTYVNADFECDLRELDLPTAAMERIMAEVVRSGTLATVPEDWGVPAWMREVYAVAGDISPDGHLLMQAALQEHVENSISKTINMPSTATVEDVEQFYVRSHELGCKGGTCYVDGSRTLQILETAATREARADACPDCKAPLRRSEGCIACDVCGYGVCGV